MLNTNEIERIEQEKSETDSPAVAFLEDGRHYRLCDDYDKVSYSFDEVIPAQPGYVLLRYWSSEKRDGDEDSVEREAIIAWQIETGPQYAIYPMVLFDREEFTGTNAILTPTGTVIHPEHRCWDNEEAWSAEMREDAARK